MRFLGIDPGYALIGFGVVEKNKSAYLPIEYGVIRTSSALPIQNRLHLIYKQILALTRRIRPDAIGVEKLFFAKNTKTAMDVSQARGVILLAVYQSNALIYEYTPLQVKQSITGYGQATKEQMQKMVKTLLSLSSIPKPDDAADALAIALCTAQIWRPKR